VSTRKKYLKVQQPDYRNNGKLQFVTGWTGGGAEMCIHLTFEEYEKDIASQAPPGRLVFVRNGDPDDTKHELLDDAAVGEYKWELAS